MHIFSFLAVPLPRSSIFVHLGIPPPVRHVLLSLLGRPDLEFDSLACSKDLALEVEAAPVLRLVEIEEPLESFHDQLQIRLSALRGRHVEDLARFVQREPGRDAIVRRAGPSLAGLLGVLLRCGRLTIGLEEGTAEDSSPGEDDLRDDPMGLGRITRLGSGRPTS